MARGSALRGALMDDSAIEWTDDTANPWWGCTKVSPACAHCYAENHARRFRVGWGPTAERVLQLDTFRLQIVRALQARGLRVAGSDIDPNAPGIAQANSGFDGDFLRYNRGGPDWIVGNPPFSGFEAHVDHALSLAPNVAFLLRLAAMESGGRVQCWQRWPLRHVWVLAERPSFTGGGTDSAAYGFFWFQRAFDATPAVTPGWSWK